MKGKTSLTNHSSKIRNFLVFFQTAKIYPKAKKEKGTQQKFIQWILLIMIDFESGWLKLPQNSWIQWLKISLISIFKDDFLKTVKEVIVWKIVKNYHWKYQTIAIIKITSATPAVSVIQLLLKTEFNISRFVFFCYAIVGSKDWFPAFCCVCYFQEPITYF